MYLHAKEGGSIEIYEVLPDSTVQNNGSQPAWETVPLRQHRFSEMFHRPELRPREWAKPARIEEYLRNVGFTRIQTTWRDYKLDAQDVSSLHHIESLVLQAGHLAHLIGMPLERMKHYQASLWHEALEHGLKARR